LITRAALRALPRRLRLRRHAPAGFSSFSRLLIIYAISSPRFDSRYFLLSPPITPMPSHTLSMIDY